MARKIVANLIYLVLIMLFSPLLIFIWGGRLAEWAAERTIIAVGDWVEANVERRPPSERRG